MGIQQWLFSFKGRIGRRDFWIWTVIWVLAMAALFYAVSFELLASQNAAFMLVCLLWPTACVIVKRLHDRNKSGSWSLLFILAWMLLAGHWEILGDTWGWVVGRFVPVLIMVTMLIDLGAFIGTQGENKFGKDTLEVQFR
ncbi:Inner membrane protein YhaI [Phytobacter ursingii]|nr:Inner membrane protein YhaI [Phytobacter ursingii]